MYKLWYTRGILQGYNFLSPRICAIRRVSLEQLVLIVELRFTNMPMTPSYIIMRLTIDDIFLTFSISVLAGDQDPIRLSAATELQKMQ